jgi:tetraacyldisaccharide 4'-kinase
VIIDDGFQHRSLHRDFDLVLLDCTTALDEDRLLPWGRLREGFESLQRSTAVALTKVNWANSVRIESLRSRIPRNLEVYEVEFHATAENPLEPGSRTLAVSGIAKPQVFQKTLGQFSEIQNAETLTFPDHFDYSQKQVDLILQRFRQLDCRQILTTEKDYVKLRAFPELKGWLNPVSLQICFREEPRGLNAFLDHCAGI